MRLQHARHSLLPCRRPPSPAAAAARGGDAGGSVPLATPADTVLAALVAARKGDADGLASLILPAPSTAPIYIANRPVTETGPFAHFHPALDAGARRVLPAHLLRRCRVVSSLPLGPGAAAVRAEVVAVTGEEAVLAWRLARRPDSGDWAVAAAARDGAGDTAAGAAARGPHPRLPPEAVVAAVVAALGRGDAETAAAFAAVPAGAVRAAAAAAAALEAAVDVCANHVVTSSAAPTPRTAWVETAVELGADDDGTRLLWRLCVGDGGGWRVTGVERVVCF